MPIFLLCRLCLLLHLCMIEHYSRQPFRPNVCIELVLRYGRNVSIIFDEGILLCEITPAEPTASRNGGDTTEIQVPRRSAPTTVNGRLPVSITAESPTTKVVPSGYRRWIVSDAVMYIKYQNQSATWHQAAAACKSEGASLIKIDTFFKHIMAVRSVMKATVQHHAIKKMALWIGLHDKFDNNTWYWLGGDRLDSTSNRYLYHQRTDNIEDRGNCAVYRVRNWETKWTDVDCQSSFGCLCELNDFPKQAADHPCKV